jgi:C-terminal processing protease CtpA/Prc
MSNFRPRAALFASFCALIVIYAAAKPSPQQKMDSITAGRVKSMLEEAHNEVKKNYYDTSFHGIDWDARYKTFNEKLKQVDTLAQGYGVIAQFLEGLNDSHTFFLPPPRPARMEYGFHIMMVGDKPFIWRVKPDSDAAAKLHPGDEVLALNKYLVKRDSFWQMNYFYRVLAPQVSSALVVRDPQGNKREVTVETKIVEEKRLLDLTQGSDAWDMARDNENANHLLRQRTAEIGDVLIWKMPQFNLTEAEVDHMFGMARKHKALILDLRDNPGGAVTTVDRMLGNLFEDEVKIADRKTRKDLKPLTAKGRGKNAFSGNLIVLIDSKSASASEVFSRVVQLEHRGTIIGDRSAGAVMESQRFHEKLGVESMIFYGFSITEADLIMKDGHSLEHVGVTPDEIVLPSASDIATSKDPALSRAAALAGITLDPEQAGKLFPYEWPHL